ncbi:MULTISPECIES: DinB family protein [Cryobacterium]|uniref:DinB family protein n=1 Tax=Cryobacterium breve TaxID=1259258 RepID=A0ABY2IUF4_9MICO|nr:MULTISPECIES: DinB family protein [Cryobacterium]TFC94865.1 DinB family protein [Cryobacterium breve]TFC94995.1 DinB family protein [Cryobacterium sp. TmT3-12]
MAIITDTKDWTWVLERSCPECGFAAAEADFDLIPRLVRENAARWQPVLQRADAAARPDDHTWSALEYAAHVRDVFRMFDQRLAMMLAEDDPAFPNWDQDATAVAERYNEQDPVVVARELAEAAASVADAFAAVPVERLGRTGRRSDGARFTVATMAQYFVHDPVHHLHDVAGD